VQKYALVISAELGSRQFVQEARSEGPVTMKIRATAAMAAALLCAASLGSAQAAPPRQSDLILIPAGAGASSCGQWLADRKGEHWYPSWEWVIGWLSAAGYYNVRGSDLRDTDWDEVTAWVDKYCREHPRNHIKDAAASLVDEWSKTK
jgi:hypothetical protein